MSKSVLDTSVVLVEGYQKRTARRIFALFIIVLAVVFGVLVDIGSGLAGISIPKLINIILDPAAADVNDRIIVWDFTFTCCPHGFNGWGNAWYGRC